MSVFKIDNYYKYMLLAISVLCVAVLALDFYTNAKQIELFLMGTASGFAVLITLYTWSIKIWTENGALCKRTLFGVKTVEMTAVDEISVITLRGRYLFMILTPGSFIMLSTMMENFPALKDILKNNITEKVFAGMDNIGNDRIARKKTVMKLMLAGLLVSSAVILVYIYLNRIIL